jgi:hypothetical protein
MLLNKYIVIYALFLVCSLGVGAIGAGYGLMVLFRRRTDDSAEKRAHLEKYLYLCTSAMFIGVLIRLVMIPLWFVMLHKLIPHIPGAMCLAGVHLNVPFYGWAASSMKLILPWLYFSWIFINKIDYHLVTQPYFKLRQILLAPLILFLFVEAFLDIKFLTGLTPTPVTCCTAIFDFNPTGIPPMLAETHWYFVILFLFSLLIQIIMLIWNGNHRWINLATAVLSIVLFFALLFGLHTRLSPLILDSPFHHCIFCLLQNNPWILIGSLLVLMAIYVSFAFGLTAFVNQEALRNFGKVRFIKSAILSLYALGTLLIAVPAMIKLLTG